MDYKLLYEMSTDVSKYAEALGLTFNPIQTEIVKDYQDNKRGNFMLPRQSGGSTLLTVLATHQAIFNQYHSIAIVTHRLAHSYELKKRCMNILERLNIPGLEITHETKTYIELSNKSKMVFGSCINTTMLRGRGFRGVYLDNTSFAVEKDYKEFMASVLPTMGSNVHCKIISLNTGDFNNTWIRNYWRYNKDFSYTDLTDMNYLNNISRLKNELSSDKFLNEYGN